MKLNPRMRPVIAQLTEQWGLDRPWYEQYFIWLRSFVTPVDVVAADGLFVVFGKLGIRSWVVVAAAAGAIVGTLGLMLTHLRLTWWRAMRVAVFWGAKSRLVFALDWGESFRGDGAVWATSLALLATHSVSGSPVWFWLLQLEYRWVSIRH